MSRILLVEDDPVLGTGLKVNLELEGHEVTWVRDLSSAQSANSGSKYELAVLDLGLPDGNGLTLCTNVREAGSRMPIIILTAQTDEDSVVRGLAAGANDYVRKPFGNREFLARVKNVLREPAAREDQSRFGEIVVLREQRSVKFNTNEIEFNRREFDIFSFLIDHRDSVVTRQRLLDFLDKEGEILDRTLDSHVSHIRSKLRKAGALSVQISSVYGVGYRLEKA
jgi:two-component system, OmpR family, response regulator